MNFSAYNTDEILIFAGTSKDGIVKTDKDSLQTASYSQNLPGQHGLALALVEAGSIADVQESCGLPAASTCQLFPRTASSTVVGADAVDHAIILSTAKMNKTGIER